MPELLGILVSMDSKIGFVTFMFKYSHQSNFHQEPFFLILQSACSSGKSQWNTGVE